MATTEELKQVLKSTLENRGVMDELKAKIRAEIFNVLDDKSESKPVLCHENLLLNELIREYLEFNKYKYTSSVFLQETGQPQEALGRDFLAHELHITQDPTARSVPLLYGMLQHFMKTRGEGFVEQDTVAFDREAEHSDELENMQEPTVQPVVIRGGK